MKKITIIIVSLLLVFTLSGCEEATELDLTDIEGIVADYCAENPTSELCVGETIEETVEALKGAETKISFTHINHSKLRVQSEFQSKFPPSLIIILLPDNHLLHTDIDGAIHLFFHTSLNLVDENARTCMR